MNNNSLFIRVVLAQSSLLVGMVFLCAGVVYAAETSGTLKPQLRAQFDATVREVLKAKGVPGASIAIVRDGRIAYLRSYGDARLEPRLAAMPEMRFCIGSVSKQFTAAAILILAEEGKLSLDDPVGRFLPNLTRAADITIRQVLSHTSGYQDYWPQDYVPPFMLRPISADQLLDRWARKPLDFGPGSEWQYSNTGYVIAGLIIERASGQPFMEFLRQRIFAHLQMKSVLSVDLERLPASDVTGYMRHGLGPLRLAPKEGNGWLFAAGELAMTAEDLAKWNISLMNQTLLSPASYRLMETAALLNNGLASNYGLGVTLDRVLSRRCVAHGGAVSGFTAQNTVFPDDKAAIVVLANGEGDAVGVISRKLALLLFPEVDSRKEEQRARRIFEDLQRGKLNRALFTDNANFYFSDVALRDLAAGLKPLGKPKSFKLTVRRERGGMTFRKFEVPFARRNLQVWQRTLPNGKIEQYQVLPSE